MNLRINKAFDFAKKAHQDQKRKFTGEPYTIHLEETVQLLWEATKGQAAVDDYVAAILHDVVEDTPISLNEIGRNFGGIVMNLVSELTNDVLKKELLGKKIYLTEKLNMMSDRALTIKLCDRLSNISGLDDNRIPNDFVVLYVKQTQYILDNLNHNLDNIQENLTERIGSMLVFLKLTRNF